MRSHTNAVESPRSFRLRLCSGPGSAQPAGNGYRYADRSRRPYAQGDLTLTALAPRAILRKVVVAMTQVMPKKLRKSPLLEALFEVRFVPLVEGAGDVLPGLIFGRLRSKYARVEQLPAAAVPRTVERVRRALVYQASHRLHGSNGASIQVGDRVAAVSTTAYPGWEVFRSMVLELLGVLRETSLVKVVERFSFRYINMLASNDTATTDVESSR